MKRDSLKSRRKLSRISLLHYFKLAFRSILLAAAAILYVGNRIRNTGTAFGGIENRGWLLGAIWLVFLVEMIFRFFPTKWESMGCQKQFAKNYQPTKKGKPKLQPWKRTFCVAAVWLALNGVIGGLFFTHIIDEGILVLISLLFSVCDMICILFFCPFQTWFMKNKCCTSCRIYNWDYAMMFTPLVFIRDPFTWTILACALALLVRWEITVHLHPERFSEASNACLSCARCEEKLCHHKKQLSHFLSVNRQQLQLKGNDLVSSVKKRAGKKGSAR